ncbi:MAG TPA: hypothetical protein V6D28_22325 [Leptolyngbyaceae cyanobacterium]
MMKDQLKMNNNEPPQNLPTIPLKESLLRLSVSPVKADRDAIARLERETGRDIQKIIAELDSTDITLKALEEKPAVSHNKLLARLRWGFFFSALVGILGLFLLSQDRLTVAIALGFALGVSFPFSRR